PPIDCVFYVGDRVRCRHRFTSRGLSAAELLALRIPSEAGAKAAETGITCSQFFAAPAVVELRGTRAETDAVLVCEEDGFSLPAAPDAVINQFISECGSELRNPRSDQRHGFGEAFGSFGRGVTHPFAQISRQAR
ncbi:hypothetical protein ACTMP8_23625, partial [Escherichia coli]|uniref:hypothetical protein n=1 Tax=Escherichia coli TaxID=562 RepID=UPI003F88D151